jgi:hypothetical protein
MMGTVCRAELVYRHTAQHTAQLQATSLHVRYFANNKDPRNSHTIVKGWGMQAHDRYLLHCDVEVGLWIPWPPRLAGEGGEDVLPVLADTRVAFIDLTPTHAHTQVQAQAQAPAQAQAQAHGHAHGHAQANSCNTTASPTP